MFEAMALGKAIVASDIPGIREVLAPSGAGLLFAEGDAAALSNALRRLVTDAGLRAELAEKAIREVSEHHDVRVTVGRIVQILEGEVDRA